MYDRFKRNINYLRISVTDRCNLRCTYCMPEDGVQLMKHDDILSFEEIVDFTRFSVEHVLNGIQAAQEAGFSPIKINAVLMGEPDEEIQQLKAFCKEKKLNLRFIHQMNLQNGEFYNIGG